MVFNVHLRKRFSQFFEQGALLDYLFKEALQTLILNNFVLSYTILERMLFGWFISSSLSSLSPTYLISYSLFEDWMLPVVIFFNLSLVLAFPTL